ncbi:MAG: hypothetical protein JST67_04380 [Bacteroidetes bacterium]|nr:hypothetical protein [Bacteroidota bacterium]
MEYIDLKEKLEKLLTEDLSNRHSLQDTRRNLFLSAEGTKVQKQLVSDKEHEIVSLNLLVEKKKSIVQQKDDEIEQLKNKLQEVQQKQVDTEELSRISIQNEEYSAKIRELIYHIDSQNTALENIKRTLAEKDRLLSEKEQELTLLSEKNQLISSSEHALKQLVAAQNIETEQRQTEISNLKKEAEALSLGWQQQHEQLLIDNASLLADLAKIEAEPVANIDAALETKSELEVEKEHLLSELNAVKHELNIIMQQRDEKVMLLQTEISELKNETQLLQNSIQNETEEKQQLQAQIQKLTLLVSEKEARINNIQNTDEDLFIDKLLSQINLLNEQKHTFETLFQSTESQLHEASESLTSLTQVVENQKSKIYDLEHSNKNIKLAQTLVLQLKDKTAAKQAINEMIREIDACIALLSE